MIGIDVSNYTTGFNARALAQVGVKRAVVQVVNERITTHREQIPALLAAGIETEAYVYQWFSGGPEFIRRRMNWALDELAVFPEVRRVWLDCEQGEDDNPPYGGGMETIEMIRLAITLAGERGYEVGIYSAKWFWDRYLHEVTEFSTLPLWAAQYDGRQDTSIVPFGGWERAEMKQYAGIGEIAGVGGIDFNWFELAPVISEEMDVRTLPLDFNETAALFRGIAAHVPEIFTDNGATAELVVSGYPDHPERDTYIVQLPRGTGRQ